MRMIKPVNVDLSLLATELGDKAVMSAFIFLPVMAGVEIYRYFALAPPWKKRQWAMTGFEGFT